jgi:hypothetical protein
MRWRRPRPCTERGSRAAHDLLHGHRQLGAQHARALEAAVAARGPAQAGAARPRHLRARVPVSPGPPGPPGPRAGGAAARVVGHSWQGRAHRAASRQVCGGHARAQGTHAHTPAAGLVGPPTRGVGFARAEAVRQRNVVACGGRVAAFVVGQSVGDARASAELAARTAPRQHRWSTPSPPFLTLAPQAVVLAGTAAPRCRCQGLVGDHVVAAVAAGAAGARAALCRHLNTPEGGGGGGAKHAALLCAMRALACVPMRVNVCWLACMSVRMRAPVAATARTWCR